MFSVCLYSNFPNFADLFTVPKESDQSSTVFKKAVPHITISWPPLLCAVCKRDCTGIYDLPGQIDFDYINANLFHGFIMKLPGSVKKACITAPSMMCTVTATARSAHIVHMVLRCLMKIKG